MKSLNLTECPINITDHAARQSNVLGPKPKTQHNVILICNILVGLPALSTLLNKARIEYHVLFILIDIAVHQWYTF